MTLQEANAMLDTAEVGSMTSKINPAITRTQAVQIVRRAINAGPRALSRDGINLDPMMEKCVYQVTRNQRRPKY